MNARQRNDLKRRIAFNAAAGNDPTHILGTSGGFAAPMWQSGTKVMASARPSIKMPFAAPRIDMGEYTPVSTHSLEAEKGKPGWTITDY